MSRDPIVDEVRAVRDAIAHEYEYDVKKLADALREEQRKSGREVVHLPPRRLPVARKAS
jgi:hypothetical protein